MSEITKLGSSFKGDLSDPNDIISGSVIGVQTSLIGSLSDTEVISGSVTIPKRYPSYSGDLEVDPKAFESIILPTANKLVADDIIVNKIGLHETENESGGITCYIA